MRVFFEPKIKSQTNSLISPSKTISISLRLFNAETMRENAMQERVVISSLQPYNSALRFSV